MLVYANEANFWLNNFGLSLARYLNLYEYMCHTDGALFVGILVKIINQSKLLYHLSSGSAELFRDYSHT